jgi:hypothetical protein
MTTFIAKRPDGDRTESARRLSVERRSVRQQYNTNGGRW